MELIISKSISPEHSVEWALSHNIQNKNKCKKGNPASKFINNQNSAMY